MAKPRQQENGGTKQPLVPPTRHRLTRNTTTAENDVLAGPNGETNSRGKVKPVVPGSEQTVLGTTQLITGRLTNEKPPPPPPPKPKIKYLGRSMLMLNIRIYVKNVLALFTNYCTLTHVTYRQRDIRSTIVGK